MSSRVRPLRRSPINPEAAAFITTAGYQVRTAQMAAAQNKTDIEFTKPSIEVKVDWIPTAI